MNYDAFVNMVAAVGGSLLENGAEIYRVEESMQRIFDAYGITKYNVLVDLLTHSSKKYPKRRNVAIELENLYSSSF